MDVIHRIRWLPHSFEEKGAFIKAKALALGLYGCEATWANETELGRLTTAIANCISPKSNNRCNALLFTMQGHKCEIEPISAIAIRRVRMFRRMWTKHPTMHNMIQDIFTKYLEVEYPGCFIGVWGLGITDASSTHWAPPPSFMEAQSCAPGPGWSFAFLCQYDRLPD